MIRKLSGTNITLFLLSLLYSAATLPFEAHQLAIITNINDPYSIALTEHYQEQYQVPKENIAAVKLPVQPEISVLEFEAHFDAPLKSLPRRIQAILMVWNQPYRVKCQSITSAVTLGVSHNFCAQGCQKTQQSAYFDHNTEKPFDDLNLRPSMLLAAGTLEQGKALIDRGRSARSKPTNSTELAKALLITTDDQYRNVRSLHYRMIRLLLGSQLPISVQHNREIAKQNNVLFMFTGESKVNYLDKIHFAPGAIGDHLTSYGGKLMETSTQMPSTDWIKAGATGSYGTVVEPCSFTEKFPDPYIAIKRYTEGESLIETYWKSVEMPGQGLFIGDPLASPFKEKPIETPIRK